MVEDPTQDPTPDETQPTNGDEVDAYGKALTADPPTGGGGTGGGVIEPNGEEADPPTGGGGTGGGV